MTGVAGAMGAVGFAGDGAVGDGPDVTYAD